MPSKQGSHKTQVLTVSQRTSWRTHHIYLGPQWEGAHNRILHSETKALCEKLLESLKGHHQIKDSKWHPTCAHFRGMKCIHFSFKWTPYYYEYEIEGRDLYYWRDAAVKAFEAVLPVFFKKDDNRKDEQPHFFGVIWTKGIGFGTLHMKHSVISKAISDAAVAKQVKTHVKVQDVHIDTQDLRIFYVEYEKLQDFRAVLETASRQLVGWEESHSEKDKDGVTDVFIFVPTFTFHLQGPGRTTVASELIKAAHSRKGLSVTGPAPFYPKEHHQGLGKERVLSVQMRFKQLKDGSFTTLGSDFKNIFDDLGASVDEPRRYTMIVDCPLMQGAAKAKQSNFWRKLGGKSHRQA